MKLLQLFIKCLSSQSFLLKTHKNFSHVNWQARCFLNSSTIL
jgi:hypothetical protein